MSTHNIGFNAELKKIVLYLSSLFHCNLHVHKADNTSHQVVQPSWVVTDRWCDNSCHTHHTLEAEIKQVEIK